MGGFCWVSLTCVILLFYSIWLGCVSLWFNLMLWKPSFQRLKPRSTTKLSSAKESFFECGIFSMFFHRYSDSVKYTSYSKRSVEFLSRHHEKMKRHMTLVPCFLHATSHLRPCLNTMERSLSYKESHAPKPKSHFLRVERLQLSSFSVALFVRSANMRQRRLS